MAWINEDSIFILDLLTGELIPYSIAFWFSCEEFYRYTTVSNG